MIGRMRTDERIEMEEAVLAELSLRKLAMPHYSWCELNKLASAAKVNGWRKRAMLRKVVVELKENGVIERSPIGLIRLI